MKIKVIEETPTHMKVLMDDTLPAVANAIRRIILGEVPVMAVDTVTMYENTSVMFDEYIAHRIGLVPLTTDLKAYKNPEDCCEGNCASCSVDLNLDESGPKVVYSSSIKTTDPKVKPVSGKIPIIELGPGERIRFEAKAVLGNGQNHAKWQVGNAHYNYISDVPMSNTICPICEAEVKGKKGDLEPGSKGWEPNVCASCKKALTAVGRKGMPTEKDRTGFIFTVETNGQMTARQAIQTAISILDDKVKNLESQL